MLPASPPGRKCIIHLEKRPFHNPGLCMRIELLCYQLSGEKFGVLHGDDRSMKIKSLEAAKIMKINWLVLGCIEADFCK